MGFLQRIAPLIFFVAVIFAVSGPWGLLQRVSLAYAITFFGPHSKARDSPRSLKNIWFEGLEEAERKAVKASLHGLLDVGVQAF